jgi:hypothetical protein
VLCMLMVMTYVCATARHNNYYFGVRDYVGKLMKSAVLLGRAPKTVR